MSVAAAVQYTQGSSGPAGQAFFGTIAGGAVQVANGNNTNVTQWTFTVIDVPPGSAVPTGVVQSGALSTWTFTPDKTGGYLVQLTVTNTGDGSTATDTRCFGVKEVSGRFVPPFKATDVMLNFGGQTRGWAVYMEAWFAYIDSLVSANTVVHQVSGTGTTTVTETSGNVVMVISAMTGPITIKFTVSTAPPTIGMTIAIKVKDTSFSNTNTISANGNGNTVEYEGSAAPASFNPGTFGTGGEVVWTWDGFSWISG
jgi:hypothetical protein